MAGQIKYQALVGLLVVLCWGLLGIDQPQASSLNYAGSWQTQEDPSGELLQKYRHSIGAGSAQELTSFLSFEETLRYGASKDFVGEVSEFVAPSLGVELSNELFRLGAIGSIVEHFGEGDISTRKLDVSWSSKRAKIYWPRLSVLFSQDEIVDERTTKVTDRQSSTLSTTADWRIAPVNLHYNLQVRESYEGVESTSHSGQASFTRSFWENRVTTNLSHNIFLSDSEKVFTIPAIGTTYIPRAIFPPADLLTGTDATPADNAEAAVGNLAMMDSVLTVGAYPIVAPSTDNNIVVPVNGQPVGIIYLYTLNNLVVPSGMTWQLYSNDILGTTWQAETLNSVTYDSTARRFEILFQAGNLTVNYLKVVVGNTAPAINFTEVVPLLVISGSPGSTGVDESEIEQNQTSFSLGYRASEAVYLNYNISVADSSFGLATETETSTHQAALNYRPVGVDYGGVLQVSRNLSQKLSGPERESNTLAITVNKTFLPTLNADFGWSMSSVQQDSQETSTSDRLFMYTTARLYPDLTGNLNTDYSNNEDLLLHEETSSLDIDLSFTSRLKRSISMTLRHDYISTDTVKSSGVTEKRQENTTKLSGNWQVSSFFVFSGALSTKDSTNEPTVLKFTGDWRFKLTPKMEAGLVYTATDDNVLKEIGLLQFNWGLSKNMKLTTYLSYAKTEGVANDDLIFNSLLTFRFSAM